MTWPEFWAAAQLLAEMRVGTLARREAAEEDAAVAGLSAVVDAE